MAKKRTGIGFPQWNYQVSTIGKCGFVLQLEETLPLFINRDNSNMYG